MVSVHTCWNSSRWSRAPHFSEGKCCDVTSPTTRFPLGCSVDASGSAINVTEDECLDPKVRTFCISRIGNPALADRLAAFLHARQLSFEKEQSCVVFFVDVQRSFVAMACFVSQLVFERSEKHKFIWAPDRKLDNRVLFRWSNAAAGSGTLKHGIPRGMCFPASTLHIFE